MALNKIAYRDGIKALMEDLYSNPNNLTTAQARDKWASDFADLTEVFIKTGRVKAGITLTSAGSASNHTGQTTGLGIIE